MPVPKYANYLKFHDINPTYTFESFLQDIGENPAQLDNIRAKEELLKYKRQLQEEAKIEKEWKQTMELSSQHVSGLSTSMNSRDIPGTQNSSLGNSGSQMRLYESQMRPWDSTPGEASQSQSLLSSGQPHWSSVWNDGGGSKQPASYGSIWSTSTSSAPGGLIFGEGAVDDKGKGHLQGPGTKAVTIDPVPEVRIVPGRRMPDEEEDEDEEEEEDLRLRVPALLASAAASTMMAVLSGVGVVMLLQGNSWGLDLLLAPLVSVGWISALVAAVTSWKAIGRMSRRV